MDLISIACKMLRDPRGLPPQHALRIRSIDAPHSPTADIGAAKTKRPPFRGGLLLYLVPEIGIEPTTYALRMRRSTN
jgi:hypothetical protein